MNDVAYASDEMMTVAAARALILTPDPVSCEFTVPSIFPGVAQETIRERTGWDVVIAQEPELVAPPMAAELAALRRHKGKLGVVRT